MARRALALAFEAQFTADKGECGKARFDVLDLANKVTAIDPCTTAATVHPVHLKGSKAA